VRDYFKDDYWNDTYFHPDYFGPGGEASGSMAGSFSAVAAFSGTLGPEQQSGRSLAGAWTPDKKAAYARRFQRDERLRRDRRRAAMALLLAAA